MADSFSTQTAWMASSAAQRFTDAAELLVLMGDHLPSNWSHQDLCLVNQRFNDIVSQFLYRRISLTATALQPKNVLELVHNPRLHFTRVISLHQKDMLWLDHFPDCDRVDREGRAYWNLPKESINWIEKAVVGIIRKCPNLHTLCYMINEIRLERIVENGFKRPSSSQKLQCLALQLQHSQARRFFSRNGESSGPLRFFLGGIQHSSLLGMFRCFLTGHASLVVDKTLPFFPPRSAASRYARLTVTFLISGLIHHHTDQLMGVSDAENGALVFFLLHAAFIMLEDASRPVLAALVPTRIHHAAGYLWVVTFFVWSSPVWIYSSTRLGIDSAALLPVRVFGPWIQRSLGTD
ncbi:hypothetical protein VP1G_06504 [Cytospora mali]|uniref:Wax synthase domain-containing protein n=1 Tax=Cytospora mali TaxID=578113 RepID=A0A194V5J3_CYTMA|nr:hypothetical protein VP1G_06504 [Valsa mali var. pyri (nom. inval.)]